MIAFMPAVMMAKVLAEPVCPDAANLAAWVDLVSPAKQFSDVGGTTPALSGDRIRATLATRGDGTTFLVTNAISDASAPTVDAGAALFNASHLDTGIVFAPGEAHTIYTYCERHSASCLVLCNGGGGGELSWWINTAGTTFYAFAGGSGASMADGVAGYATRGAVIQGLLDGRGRLFVGGVEADTLFPSPPGHTLRIGDVASGFPYTGHNKHVFAFRGVHDLDKRTQMYEHINLLVNPPDMGDLEIEVVVSVHYEGTEAAASWPTYTVAQEALRAMVPGAKLSHFLSPCYETEGASQAAVIAEFMPRVFARDQLGLHVHVLDSLATAAGATPRSMPSYVGAATSVPGGYQTILDAYTLAELIAIFTEALDRIEAYGKGRPTGFVAGGWHTTAKVREALRTVGILVDLSPVPDAEVSAHLVASGFTYLDGLIAAEWPTLTRTSQPYTVSTPAGTLKQVVSNGGMADYDGADPADILARFVDVCTAKAAAPGTRHVFVASCHYSATAGVAALRDALVSAQAYAAANGFRIKWVTANEAAA